MKNKHKDYFTQISELKKIFPNIDEGLLSVLVIQCYVASVFCILHPPIKW